MSVLSALFYNFLWIILRLGIGFFYRDTLRKAMRGMEHIPADKPVIFCVNHPSAFMDAILVATACRRRVRFLVRSDVMRKPLQKHFLRFIGLIPIYRMQEGIENLSKNDETFIECHQLLAKKKAIIIFSEGLCIQERRLRKLKKGTARIAFGAEDRFDFKLDLQLVPIGINYSSAPWKFRSRMSLQFGKPVAVREFEAMYKADKARAINAITKRLEEAMAEQLIIIDEAKDDVLVERLEEVAFAGWNANSEYKTAALAQHDCSLELTHLLREARAKDVDSLELLRSSTEQYFQLLKENELRDRSVFALQQKQISRGKALVHLLALLVFGGPLWLFGVITNYIPYKVPFLVAQKIVRNIEWHASVNITIGVFLWIIWWLLQSLVVALCFRNWWLLWAFMALVPISGYFAQWAWTVWKKNRGHLKATSINREALERLYFWRHDLDRILTGLRKKFPMVR